MSYCNNICKLFSHSIINSSRKVLLVRNNDIYNRIFNISKISYKSPHRLYSVDTEHTRPFILGIETSCDDTGCAIVDGKGSLLGEALHSQHLVHLKNGGIIPPVAKELHSEYIEPVVEEALKSAHLTVNDIDAIALTVKPGLPMSLMIGIKYAKYLAKQYSKPIIPIHHMEAHALMARMENQVEFPFLVLLISGGHSLLAFVEDVNDFRLLGHSLDDAPGEAFDKVARRLKLRNLDEFSKLSGGQAIELAATKADNPLIFEFPLIMSHLRDCDFSFGGLKNKALRYVIKKEEEHGIVADGIIPEVYNLCAAFQISICRHLCHRTQRAIKYLDRNNMIPDNNRTLVVSGGVACNNFVFKCLKIMCEDMDFKVIRPRPKLCTDNGIMIAWNGVEKWNRKIDIVYDLDSIEMSSKSTLGEDIRNKVTESGIDCRAIKMKDTLRSDV